jgi:hypothetical protein
VNPNPYVSGTLSGSVIILNRSGSFHQQAKKVGKTWFLLSCDFFFWLLFWLFIYENRRKCTFKKYPNKQKLIFVGILLPLTKKAGSGYVCQWYGSTDLDPDPYQYVTDPHWQEGCTVWFNIGKSYGLQKITLCEFKLHRYSQSLTSFGTQSVHQPVHHCNGINHISEKRTWVLLYLARTRSFSTYFTLRFPFWLNLPVLCLKAPDLEESVLVTFDFCWPWIRNII